MARRGSRKGFFRRSAPDRGWWIAEFTGTATHAADTDLAMISLLDFSDLTSGESALITQDKSDWFIKRVLFNFYPSLSRASATSATARIYQAGLCTMDVSEQATMVTAGAPVISAAWFDACRRTLRTYQRPLYANANLGSVANATSTTASAPTNIATFWGAWGDAHIEDDMEVSNAGLVENSGLYAAFSTQTAGPGSFDWASGDAINAYGSVRVLLQKRRDT